MVTPCNQYRSCMPEVKLNMNFCMTCAGEESGFWFGTQSLLCLTSPSHVAINNRNADRFKRQASISRADWHYIHRLIYYKQHVFEWGAGARGYYVGPHAAVTDCPTTWEVLPAGHSTCSVEQLRLFATSYKRTYGGYNLLANNCHHFANRAALLLLRNCTGTSTDDVTNTSVTTTASSVRSEITSWAWNAMKWILSHVTSDTEP
jgi:hypothetical protein